MSILPLIAGVIGVVLIAAVVVVAATTAIVAAAKNSVKDPSEENE